MIEIDSEALEKLKSHFKVHPLIFHRTMEKAQSTIDLFDLLKSIPNYPISWDDSKHSWVKETDILGRKRLKK